MLVGMFLRRGVITSYSDIRTLWHLKHWLEKSETFSNIKMVSQISKRVFRNSKQLSDMVFGYSIGFSGFFFTPRQKSTTKTFVICWIPLQVDEMPFLLAQAGELKQLKATILNIAVFQRLMATEEGKYQLIKSWHLVCQMCPIQSV